jgi:hypothetical protein
LPYFFYIDSVAMPYSLLGRNVLITGGSRYDPDFIYRNHMPFN